MTRAAATVLLAGLALSACAGHAYRPAEPRNEARAAAEWVESRTDYTIATLPVIVTTTRDEIGRMSGGLTAYGTREAPRLHYLNGVIRVWDEMRGDSRDGGIVHEMVHHAQTEAGMTCPGAMEYEAHTLHQQFMRERGHRNFGRDWDWENLRLELNKCAALEWWNTIGEAEDDRV